MRAGLCAEVCADFTVDGDATRRDQLITMPARSDASGCEKTVEAHAGKKLRVLLSAVFLSTINSQLTASRSHIWFRFRQADDFTVFLPLTPLL